MYIFSFFPFGFEGRIWDLIVSVPDHCLSFYFSTFENTTTEKLHYEQYLTLFLQSCESLWNFVKVYFLKSVLPLDFKDIMS